ncbi:MAG: response regulator transcription factor [Synergistaceae bacterium]|nr:response regulator transcription factor [Synergistaceae bacterium]
MNLNIALVEDSKRDADKLSSVIHKFFLAQPELERSITLYNDGGEFLRAFEPEKFHIIFMDILMNDINGIQTAGQVRLNDSKVLIIFTTSSREFALESFFSASVPVRPFDYILKPYDSERLCRTLTEAVKILESPDPALSVRVSRSTYNIPFRKISAVLSSNHVIEIVMTDNNCLIATMTFNEIENILLADKRFLLCNRGLIINMDSVRSLSKDKEVFIMKTGDRYPLRVRGRAKVIEDFTQYQISRLRGGVHYE